MSDTPDPRPTESAVAGAPSPDTDDTVRDRRLRRELAAATTEVDTGSADAALAEVREIAHRRRRRRSTILGVAAAGVLVVGGVVVAGLVNDRSGEDRIVSAPATESSVDTSASVPSSDGSLSADAPVGEVTDPVATVAETEPTAPSESSGTAAVSSATFESGSFVQRLAWKDGFVAIGQTSTSQPLPAELPEEISSRFPPEVTALFDEAGGLPPTIDEAISMLSEAGLLDVVSEIVTSDPEVSDVIYSQPIPEPIVTVQVSDDGITWTSVDVNVPGSGYDRHITSSGDRLVVATPVVDPASTDDSAPGPSPVDITAFAVFSTTDLQTWTEQTIELPAPTASPFVRRNTYLSQLAASDTGWVIGVDSYEELDVVALLPDDLGVDVVSSEYGYGTSYDDDGVRIEYFGESGSESVSYTWAELGFDAPPASSNTSAAHGAGPFQDGQQVWSATWDGVPTAVTTGPGYATIVGFDGGFLRSGTSVQFSADGVTWSDIDAPGGPDSWMAALISDTDSVAALVIDSDGTPVLRRLDVASLSWSTVDGLELGRPFSPWNDRGRGALLYTMEPDAYSEPVDESVGVDQAPETNMVDRDALDVPATEAPVMEVPATVVSGPETTSLATVALDETGESEMVVVDDGPPGQPAMRVLATDGEGWVDLPIDMLPAGDEAGGPQYVNDVVANNGSVVVSLSDGSALRIEI